MIKNKLILFAILVGAISACGGRSAIKVNVIYDGGEGYDGSTSADGKRDGLADGAKPTDALANELGRDGSVLDAPIADGARLDTPAITDGKPDGGTDVAITDGRLDNVGRLDNSGQNDGARPDGAEVRPPVDGSQPELGRPEAGRFEVPPFGTDARDGNPPPTDTAPPTLTGIEISPASPITINVGTPRTLTITAIYSNNTNQDVSSSAKVTSADTSILTVSGTTLTGLGTKVATTTITATYQGQTATATVNVNGTNPLVKISINRVPTTDLAVGATVNLVATGVFADGTSQDVTAQATWASSAPSVATVGDTGATKGQVTAVAAGTFTVTATVGTIVGTSTTMTVSTKKLVSIAITPSNPTLQRGLNNQAFLATGTYDNTTTGDVTQQATWSSSNTGVLTVVATGANAGRVATVGAGQATITATVGSISGTDVVTVTQPALRTITISGPSVLIVGSFDDYIATGTYADNTSADLTTTVTWSSTNTNNLTVSNAAATPGRATAVAAGTATIRATLGTVVGQLNVTVSDRPLISITVAPAAIDALIVGLTSQLKATGLYGDPNDVNTQFSIDVTSAATWTVDSAFATVGNGATAGLVTGVSVGKAIVTATLSGKNAQATVNVVNATLLSITVNPSAASVRVGQTYPFTATGSYDNGTTPDITDVVTWNSSNTATATISNAAGSHGVATGVAASTTAVTITATITTTAGTKTATANLTVNEPRLVSIFISPATAQTISAGATQAYTVTGVYENGTQTNALTGVTWSSSDTGVATIAAGRGGGPGPGPGGAGATATSVGAGTTTITATYTPTGGTALTDSVTLNVQPPVTVIAIRLNPATASITVGSTQTYTVNADYDNGTTAPITGGVTLTTSNGTVASVGGGGPGGGGLTVTGQAVGGPVTITASYTSGGTTFTDTASLTITAACPVTGLYIEPPSATVTVDGTQQYRAYTRCSNGTTTDVTANASTAWTTSDGTLATITTNSTAGGRGAIFTAGGGGLATGVAATTTPVTITAAYTPASGSAVTATASLTVTDPPILSLQIQPTDSTVYLSSTPTQQFRATVIYTDYSQRDVTTTAQWGSTNSAVAVISNSGATIGRATGLTAGTSSITAAYSGNGGTFNASTTLTVADRKLTAVQVTPTNPTTHLGVNQPFVATAVFDTGSPVTVTGSATWTSDDDTVASVVTGGASAGVATPLKAGSANITASYGGFSGSSKLTVDPGTLSSINITPSPLSVVVGGHQQLTATGNYTSGPAQDLTNSVTWLSTDAVATVSNANGSRGLLTAVSAGTAAVSAKLQGVTGALNVTVTASGGTIPDAAAID